MEQLARRSLAGAVAVTKRFSKRVRMTSKDRLQARRTKEDKLRRHRDLQLESVRTHIVPVLIQQGFVVTPRISRGPVDRKSLDIFPFGEMRRARDDGGVDLVEIQFKTYKRPAFRINAAAVPKEGMMTAGGHQTSEELHAGGLHDHFEMYASPRLWIWFSLRFWWFRSPTQSEYQKLALRVATFLPEIDLALREGELGPHMRRIVMKALPPEILERVESFKRERNGEVGG